MPDWKKFVRKRMAALPRGAKEEVIAEFALHLEEAYEQARSAGVTKNGAIRIALQEVADWRVLSDNIRRATQENTMNHRTKTVLLPGVAILFVVGLTLVFMDRAALLQRLIWLASMALLLGAAASEAEHLNHRTRSVWLPGFVSLAAAVCFLFSFDLIRDPSRFFQEITLHPESLLRMSSGASHSFYFVWLSAQVAFGALGALFSRRAGGTRAERVVAGAFPAVVIVGTYVALMPFTSMFSGRAGTESVPLYLVSAMLVWVVAPAITLGLGAAPFLRESSDRRASQLC